MATRYSIVVPVYRNEETIPDLLHALVDMNRELDDALEVVLVVDGSFLQRELTWDEVVFVDTPFEVAHDRGTRRDAELLGGLDQARLAFEQRYHAASRRYLTEVAPAARASVVIGNEDFAHPVLRRIGG